jgi:hypothetical protein
LQFEIFLSIIAQRQLEVLRNPAHRATFKAIDKTINLMVSNLRHPSLNTHEFHGLKGPDGEKILESYAQNKTPGAYRIFWYYGPGKNKLTILAITAHP